MIYPYYLVVKGGFLMESQVYGYARVSSKDQNQGRQIEALRDVGVAIDHIFTDMASGKDFDREEYKKLKAILIKGDILIIKSIDRLGRNYNEILQEWKTITKDLEAHIKVIDLPLLDTTQNGKDLTGTFIVDLVLQILSYVAEQERVNIRQRQAEGIALAKAEGRHLGRPRAKRPARFDEVYEKWSRKEIPLEIALKMLGLKRTTFFKLAAENKKGEN